MENDESNEADINIICPSEEQLLNNQYKKELVCPVGGCGKTMSNSSSMKMHLAQTHRHGDEATIKTYNKAFGYPKPKTVFACPVSTCARKLGSGKYFIRIGPLREHYLSAHAEKKHICTKCGAKFGNPKRIDQHMKGCGKIYKCSCGTPFKRKAAAIEHAVRCQHKLPESIRSELATRNEEQKKEEINRQRLLKQIEDNKAGSSKQISSERPVGIRGINGFRLIAPNSKSVRANTFLLILNGNQSKQSSIPSNNQVNVNDRNSKQSDQDRSVASTARIMIENRATSLSISRDGQVIDRSSKDDQSIASVISGPATTTGNAVNDFVSALTQNKTNDLENMDEASTAKQKLSALNGVTTGVDIAQPPQDMRTARSAERTITPPQQDIKKAKTTDQTGKNGSKKIEKLKRLKEAMKKYVPILKKNPSVSQIINRPNKATSVRFTNQQPNRVVNVNFIPPKKDTIPQQDDHNSLMSIQNCLQKAAVFVNRTLPGICSPERVEGSGLNIGYSVVDLGKKSVGNETKENTVSEKKSTKAKCKSVTERTINSSKHTKAIKSSKLRTATKARTCKVQSFIRYESYTEDMEPSHSIIDNKVTRPKSVTSQTTNKKDARDGKVYKNKTHKLKRNAIREQLLAPKRNRENTQNGFNPKFNEFCLDGLSNEFLDLLKNSPDVSNNALSAGETVTQETQTSCNIVPSEMAFQNAYNTLATYVNSDTQTKPGDSGDCSSVLSDAFTQTNQSKNRLTNANATNFQPQFSSENFVNQSPTWLNNETQTDNLNDILADAFTQTRFSAPEHQASQTCMSNNNISDNHTQTNLSFDNLLVDLNFDDQNSLDVSLIPDFADMCTQTNFDPEVKELLEMASAGSQTVISATSLEQAESSNCHTQTRLTFDDLFSSAFAGDEYDRELNDMYTQTIIP